MGFWFFMLLCAVLIPVVMIGFGKAVEESSAKRDQCFLWLSYIHVHEECGYLGVRTPILWKDMVHLRLGAADSFGSSYAAGVGKG